MSSSVVGSVGFDFAEGFTPPTRHRLLVGSGKSPASLGMVRTLVAFAHALRSTSDSDYGTNVCEMQVVCSVMKGVVAPAPLRALTLALSRRAGEGIVFAGGGTVSTGSAF